MWVRDDWQENKNRGRKQRNDHRAELRVWQSVCLRTYVSLPVTAYLFYLLICVWICQSVCWEFRFPLRWTRHGAEKLELDSFRLSWLVLLLTEILKPYQTRAVTQDFKSGCGQYTVTSVFIPFIIYISFVIL